MTPLRIGLHLTPAVRQRAGIGRYTRELARALVRRAHHDYVFLVADLVAWSHIRAAVPEAASTALRTTGIPARWHTILWQRLGVRWPVESWTGRLDLFHEPDFLAPYCRAPAVITIHDLSFLRHPQRAAPGLLRFLGPRLPGAVARAAHILADSHFTRRELMELLDVPAQKITVAYPGVSPAFRPPSDQAVLEAVRSKYELRRPFVLGVGTLEPRKDWPVLIQAFERLGDIAGRYELVIAGRRGWLAEDILQAAARAGERVRLLGFVDDQDLPALYHLADAFAYPSLYEGFGLPPLEALACGVPTVVAATSSLPEVVGDAALTAPPGQPEELAGALARLLTDQALRARLAARGPVQAARFTWERCAAAVEEAYAAVG